MIVFRTLGPRQLFRIVTLIMLFGMVACNMPSCGQIFGPGGIDVSQLPPTTPRLAAQRPYPGEELPLDGSIDLYFDQTMDQASVESALSIDPPIQFSLTWVDDATLRITPATGQLARAQTYSLTVAASAASADGLTLEEPLVIAFQTVGFLRVSEVVPAPDTTGAETQSVITVLFNRPVVPLGIAEDSPDLPQPLQIEPDVPGRGEWLNTSIYQWHPDRPLAGATTYTVSIDAGLTDQTGGVLEAPYSWQFTTLPPDIVSVSPSGGETQIGLDVPVTVEFNQPMDQASTQAAFSLVEQRSGQATGGGFEWDETGQIMTFQPAGLLALDGQYAVTINTSARAVSGAAGLSQTFSWDFYTVATPAVLSTDPANGDQNVPPYYGMRIVFSAPMDPDTLEGRIVADPPLPDDATFFYADYDNSYNVSAAFEPSTAYSVTIRAGAADPYGNRVNQPHTFSFTTGPLDPMVQLNTQGQFGLYDASRPTELFMLHRNVVRVDFTLARISPQEFGQLTDIFAYEFLYNFRPSPEQIVRQWGVDTPTTLNESTFTRVPMTEDGSALAPGIYLLIVDDAETEGDIRHFMIVTNANLTFKTSFDESLVWLTDLQSGQPIGGAQVTLYDQDFSQVAQASTNASGAAEIASPHRVDLYERRYAVVDSGGVFAVALSDWGEGVQAWDYGLGAQYFHQSYSLYLHSDRPIYRPGQEVFFRGVLRAKNDTTYGLHTLQQIAIMAYDDQGEVIHTETLPVSEFGTFNGSLTLAEEAGLGYYSIQAQVGDQTVGLGFQVADYRVPEFMVNVSPEAPAVVQGGTINVTVDAEYFFGGPVSNAEVTWTALADRYFFDYSGPGQYFFNDFDYDDDVVDETFIPGFGEVIAEGDGITNADGDFVITLPANLGDADSSRRLTIEATVTDENDQPVSGRTEVVVHQGQYYPGVQPDSFVGLAGEEQSASIIVVDWDGQPVGNQQVSVELVERRWRSVQEEDEFGRTVWTWSVEEIPVGRPITARTDAQGRATVSFTPPAGGVYKIRAAVRDPAGNTVLGSAFMWVASGDYISWRQANNYRIDLITDQETYRPGDTAEILIASPFQGEVQALVTVERGSILTHEVITLTSNSTIYSLPITGDLAPDVYVSVTIVKGADSTNPIPAFRMGMVRIGVEPIEQTLTLEVAPDRQEVGPGEDVTYTITTTDFQGTPVNADVSLALVDLATLSLAAPNSGPILDHFYGFEPLGVQTAIPLIYLVDRLNQSLFDEGKGGGGGEGEGFFDLRTEFEDTAYWSGQVTTGDDGVAEVTITLPDNLTTWRMDARAVTANTLVGQAESDIVATRPLLIRPVTPRFFVVGDEATLSATVNNNTGNQIRARVSLTAEGASIVGRETQMVAVPASGRVEVFWPVVVDTDVDWVDLIFAVEGGGLSDSSRPPLGDRANDQLIPVYRYEVPETVGTAGQIISAGSRLEGIVLPPTYDVQQARVDVQIDPSLAASMLDGLDWLEHYPYECTEQIVSKFLPNALTLIAYREFGLSDPTLEANLQANLSIGLQKLYAQQHIDGGWGWFAQATSSPTVTAYVLQGMVAAELAGFDVSDRVMADGLAFLQNNLQSLDTLDESHELDRQAYVLYVLALAGQPDVSRTVQLYDSREGLQSWARALLAQTLWRIDPTDQRLDALESDLVSSAILSATGAHWEEDHADVWNWNTDTRSTAIILDTFALLWPENDIAPNATRWLMTARTAGHWETTQETAWALIGLTDWMVATEELDANYDWEFTLNGRPLASGHAGEDTVRDSTAITIDLADLLTDHVNRLSFSRGAGAGRMYYTAHLTAYLPVEEVEPLSRGVIVSRRYLDEAGEPVTQGRVGDVLTVELNIIAPHDLYYVVVTDPYPAGAEAVDVSLQTESVLGQRPTLRPDDPLYGGWGWWWFSETDLRDQQAELFADFLPAGTYQYIYQLRLGIPGTYRVIPSVAQEFYFPEVYGRGEGILFTILPE